MPQANWRLLLSSKSSMRMWIMVVSLLVVR
jgi:hypothetical protein